MKLIDNDKEHFKLKVLACPVSKKSCMLLESTIRHEGFEMASKWLQRRKRDKKRQTYKLQLNFRTCFVLMDYPTEMPQTSPVEHGFIVLTPTST